MVHVWVSLIFCDIFFIWLLWLFLIKPSFFYFNISCPKVYFIYVFELLYLCFDYEKARNFKQTFLMPFITQLTLCVNKHNKKKFPNFHTTTLQTNNNKTLPFNFWNNTSYKYNLKSKLNRKNSNWKLVENSNFLSCVNLQNRHGQWEIWSLFFFINSHDTFNCDFITRTGNKRFICYRQLHPAPMYTEIHESWKQNKNNEIRNLPNNS